MMTYPTPPLTNKKHQGGIFRTVRFSSPVASPIYYENVYGVESDEDVVVGEGGSDVCESDSDSEVKLSPSKQTKTQGLGGSKSKPAAIEDTGKAEANVPFLEISDDSGSSSDEVAPRKTLEIQTVQSENKGAKFRIAPKTNPKRSLLLPNRKFGMFGRWSAQRKNDNQTKGAQSKPRIVSSPDSEDDAALQNESEPKQIKASARMTRKTTKPGLRRPAHRKLLKQQLANRSQEIKNEKAAIRGMGKAEKDAKRTLQKGEMQTAQVQVDKSNIDLSSHKKYD